MANKPETALYRAPTFFISLRHMVELVQVLNSAESTTVIVMVHEDDCVLVGITSNSCDVMRMYMYLTPLNVL